MRKGSGGFGGGNRYQIHSLFEATSIPESCYALSSFLTKTSF